MFKIDRGSSAVVFTCGVNGAGALEGSEVSRKRLLGYSAIDLAPSVERPAQEVLSIGTDEALRRSNG